MCIVQARWSALNLTTPSQPSMPGRNQLPDAPEQLTPLAGAMASTHQLVGMWAAYGIIQAFTLVLLVARWADDCVWCWGDVCQVNLKTTPGQWAWRDWGG